MKNKRVVFTICAKNYLAQALSLRESTLKRNDVDFYIFLSDKDDEEGMPEVVLLDDEWIPNWQQMAFKYDVIEFSTSIKPFCFQKLFKDGYERVIYLDPDIYVYNSLDIVFSALDNKSIVLTPHRCYITDTSDDMIPEQLVSSVGIYNCGFIAIKNDIVGNKVVNWWGKKLSNQCLCDLSHGLFVDQKWIDFVPGYYPNDILISNHLGMNVATWNLQERLIFQKDGTYYVKSRVDNQQFPLMFFHFSGYNPHLPSLLHKRKERSDIKFFPEMEKMVTEYREAEIRNEYDRYSKMKYSFNFFSDGTPILAIHRQLYYRNLQDSKNVKSPFDANGYLYTLYVKRGLITGTRKDSSEYQITRKKKLSLNQKIANTLFRLLGTKNYLKLIGKFATLGSYSYYDFLVDE